MNKIELNNTSYIILSSLPNDLSVMLKENFEQLFSYHPQQRGSVIMYNNNVKCERWFQSYLSTPEYNPELEHSYMFSGTNPSPQPALPLEFQEILNYINQKEIKYNQVVVNWYRDENDYIPFHSDYEYNKVFNSGVIIVNLTLDTNPTRDFVLKPKKHCDGEILNIPLFHGQIIEMHGDTQKTYRHGVPKSKHESGPRISLTFRAFQI